VSRWLEVVARSWGEGEQGVKTNGERLCRAETQERLWCGPQRRVIPLWQHVAVTSPGSISRPKVRPTPKLVYGYVDYHDSLAFADAETAAEEAEEIRAIASAGTWGDARRIRTRHIWNPAEIDEGEDPKDYPPDDAPFDIYEVPCVADGDWPGMVTRRAIELLPEDIHKFGEIVHTTLNGEYLHIPAEREAELVAELRSRGFEVTRNDDLINMLDANGLERWRK